MMVQRICNRRPVHLGTYAHRRRRGSGVGTCARQSHSGWQRCRSSESSGLRLSGWRYCRASERVAARRRRSFSHAWPERVPCAGAGQEDLGSRVGVPDADRHQDSSQQWELLLAAVRSLVVLRRWLSITYRLLRVRRLYSVGRGCTRHVSCRRARGAPCLSVHG